MYALYFSERYLCDTWLQRAETADLYPYFLYMVIAEPQMHCSMKRLHVSRDIVHYGDKLGVRPKIDLISAFPYICNVYTYIVPHFLVCMGLAFQFP
jgi:hypothetical protein